MEVRLNKFLAESLGISRREADDLIGGGKILINGKVALLGARVRMSGGDDSIDNSDIVCYNGGLEGLGKTVAPGVFGVSKDGKIQILPLKKYVYLAINKPIGYVCSRKRQGDTPTIFETLPEKYQKLKTVGRLDKDSSGLILLTNDGEFAFKMTHPKFLKTKEYEVKLDHSLAPLHQQMIADFGIEIGDGVSKLSLTRLDDERKRWKVEMHEGRNRQIRRTFGALGYTVVDLHRVRFGKYELGGLASGEFMEINP